MVNRRVGEFVNGVAHTGWRGAILQRGHHGTLHPFAKKHMNVDEFSFRWNEGNCQVDTLDRMSILYRRMVGKRLRHKELVAG